MLLSQSEQLSQNLSLNRCTKDTKITLLKIYSMKILLEIILHVLQKYSNKSFKILL